MLGPWAGVSVHMGNCLLPHAASCPATLHQTRLFRSRWNRHAELRVEIPCSFLGVHERRKTTETRNLPRRRRGRLCEFNIRVVGHFWTQSFQVLQVRNLSSRLLLLLQVLTAVAEAADDRVAARWPRHLELKRQRSLQGIHLSTLRCLIG